MMSFLDPYNPYDNMDDPSMKDLTDDERLSAAILQGVMFVIAITAVMLVFGLCFTSCVTPRAVEEHHHHHYEVDTLAVHALVDRQLTSWHEDMTQYFQQRLEQYSSQQQQSEHQRETVTEQITTTTDSVGRTIRQEQRAISRSMVNAQWSMVNSVKQEYEARLHAVVDSVSNDWQQRFDSLSSHLTSAISHQTSSTPVGDTRPWYQRLWDIMRAAIVALLIAAVLYLARRLGRCKM